MKFDWKSFNRLSMELISNQSLREIEEAYFRTAVSRSYYSAFCCARNFLVNKTGINSGEHVHEFVRNEYERSVNRVEQTIGANLNRLFRERLRADYDDTAGMDINRARTAHALANAVLKSLEKLDPLAP